ncbi:hypothetical protein E4633_20250 [Geomonas terrae]|uniref:HNH nuclease domain-containing protein n=2 Tax=Geomonas terrae TaxID=2562681 RepID=A0A4S1C9J9_9BACT|nr:hypothetical protein E4633_20250 [Geomonas terrae]
MPQTLQDHISLRLATDVAAESQLQDYVVKPSPKSYPIDLTVIIAAATRANGKCELCEQPAPFLRANGDPYLEAHHIKPLGEGGLDTVYNVAMLCPNCHRRIHYAKNEDDDKKLISGCKKCTYKF